MVNNTIAIWACIISANIWSASNHEDGGASTFGWLVMAAVFFVKDALEAKRISETEIS